MPKFNNAEQARDDFEHGFTWLAGFMRNARKFHDRPALHDPERGKRWTYAELNADANRLAHAFQKDGLGRGDVCMFMLFNSPEFALSYIACHKLGAVACPINFRLSASDVAALIDDSEPAIFLYDARFGETAREALELAEHAPARVIACDAKEGGHITFETYTEGMPQSDPELSFRPNTYDETTRLYTSGTTKRARAVPLSSLNEAFSAHDVIMHFPLAPTDRTMNMTPWFHRGGLHSGGLTPTLFIGGEVVILREFNPKTCLAIAEREKVTFLIGVPSILALLARAQERQPVELSGLRGIVTMGSPFEKSACEYYRKLFTPNIFNGYGTTETFWNTFLRPWNLPEMSGSAGQSCTDDDVRVVRLRKDGKHSEPDDLVARDGKEVGEIIIRAPTKSPGHYHENPEMDRQKFYRGFHYTGDLGTWDKNEFVTIVSRKDDMIIVAGENIYPTQIEAVLNSHPKVAECAVVGQPDRLHGQRIAAYVVPLDDSLTVEELRNYCVNNKELSVFKRPRHFRLVSELPHTATGKIMHFKVREMALEEARKEQSEHI